MVNPKMDLLFFSDSDIQQRNMMAMMVSLQRRLQAESIEDREQQFFAHTLRYLTTSSGRQVEMEDWMITSYEVEFGHEIGSGGLYGYFSCSRGASADCFRQWTGVQGELEKGSSGTQGTSDGRWCRA
jgi:hypothetical protein